MAADRKVPCTINFTARQIRALETEAKRLGVPVADAVRRIVDGWIDAQPQRATLAGKVYEGAR